VQLAAVSDNGKKLAVAGKDGSVLIFDLEAAR